MSYTHRMSALPGTYDTAAIEKKWQAHWLAARTYAWDPEVARADSYVIDTPPPTVSGTLHMGHVFSYTQADFIARFQRMNGKNVFYPMGFDDNGLPTERLVEKTKKIRAVDMSREAFIAECLGVSEEARAEFRTLFQSIALSVDWDQEYHTISESSRRLSQLSFLDLVNKGHCYRAQRPFYWDPVDQTAIASAEIEDKELPSNACDIIFRVCRPEQSEGPGEKNPQPDPSASHQDDLTIMTTRPELLPACVALFCHPEDTRYTHLIGRQAEVPLFGFSVPILADDTVEMEKGTGLMMCCTFGDDADIAKWNKHQLPTRVVINKFGKMDFGNLPEAAGLGSHSPLEGESKSTSILVGGAAVENTPPGCAEVAHPAHPQGVGTPTQPPAYYFQQLQGKKVSNVDAKHLGARQVVIELLREAGLLVGIKPITHAVKCAERSGAPLEILPTSQWFVKVTDKKAELTARARECNWNPEWMRLRIEQWIDGLNQDWCISRQRYFGVPFPVWYAKDKGGKLHTIYAKINQLPVNPLKDCPAGFKPVACWNPIGMTDCIAIEDIYDVDGNLIFKGDGHTWIELYADPDVMDTWATSSISPQLSARAIHGGYSPLEGESKFPLRNFGGGRAVSDSPPGCAEGANPAHPHGVGTQMATVEHHSPLTTHHSRFKSLFPADLRPQAHEIIRTWAFYTIVKAHLHNDSVPWHNLMISGWCLAEDKSKMSKSKGNVVTPVALIEEKGTDAVRYWAGTSRLGTDTAFSPDLLKIGKKLVGKLWNATAFAAIHLSKLGAKPLSAKADMESGAVCEVLDRWILSRLGETVTRATNAFSTYEYADALDATNQFFWADFCDNYLELIKKRVYNEDGSASAAAQQSAIITLYHCLQGILKLYAPFVPHVTEELYSHIFAEDYAANGSLHTRGQWPNTADYPERVMNGSEPDHYGLAYDALNILEVIRSRKSQSKVSIKHPIKQLKIAIAQDMKAIYDLQYRSMLEDVRGAGNVLELTISYTLPKGTSTQVSKLELAPEADVA